jgi:hypothetical protein
MPFSPLRQRKHRYSHRVLLQEDLKQHESSGANIFSSHQDEERDVNMSYDEMNTPPAYESGISTNRNFFGRTTSNASQASNILQESFHQVDRSHNLQR